MYRLYDDEGTIKIGSIKEICELMEAWLIGGSLEEFDYIEAEDLYNEDEIGNALSRFRVVLKRGHVERYDDDLGFTIIDMD